MHIIFHEPCTQLCYLQPFSIVLDPKSAVFSIDLPARTETRPKQPTSEPFNQSTRPG